VKEKKGIDIILQILFLYIKYRMRKHILLAKGSKYIHKPHIIHALHTHQHLHKKGSGFAGVQKKNIGTMSTAVVGEGRKHHGRRLTPLKFKL
jgi:hypothetical protein